MRGGLEKISYINNRGRGEDYSVLKSTELKTIRVILNINEFHPIAECPLFRIREQRKKEQQEESLKKIQIDMELWRKELQKYQSEVCLTCIDAGSTNMKIVLIYGHSNVTELMS